MMGKAQWKIILAKEDFLNSRGGFFKLFKQKLEIIGKFVIINSKNVQAFGDEVLPRVRSFDLKVLLDFKPNFSFLSFCYFHVIFRVRERSIILSILQRFIVPLPKYE